MSIALTTLTDVKLFLELGVDTSKDAMLTALIGSASDACERYIDRITLTAVQTQEYELWGSQSRVLLRAFPVSASPAPVFKYASTTSNWGTVSALTVDEVRVDLGTGEVHLNRSTPFEPGYLQAVYTGGMGVDTAGFKAAFPELSMAVARQVAYEFRRRDKPASNVSVQGGTTSYTGELGLLKESLRVYEAHRRVVW